MVKPDFLCWAQNVMLSYKLSEQHYIETALKQAFDQGYQLGLNKGWAIEQDKERR